MALDSALLAIGLVILVWSADQFVLGSARLARIIDLPPIVIGAVVMGFGTSAPEMIVSGIAAAGGDRELGIGNVIGSNVANLSLVLGTAAFITTMAIPKVVFRREGPLSIGSAALFAVFVADGAIERWEGIVLALCLLAVVALLISSGHHDPNADDDPGELRLTGEATRAGVGLVGTVVGAQMVVLGATDLADELGVSGGFIGFSLVALGTSLPELVTTFACARRSETELIVGNLFGSNIFNALAVGGVVGIVGPGVIDDDMLTGVGLVLMLAVAVYAYVSGFIGYRIGRFDGTVLLSAYVGIMIVLGTGASDDGQDSAPPSGQAVTTDLDGAATLVE